MERGAIIYVNFLVMLTAERGDIEDLENISDEASELIDKNKTEQQDIPFCGCLSIRYYQPFFDVDTSDIGSRLLQATFFCKREKDFISSTVEKPDAYGPFWISTTLIFTVAVTSHISNWLSSWMSGKNWVYDFQSVVTVASLVYSFVGIVPLSLWFILRQLEAKVKLISLICLYGYSLFIFIPASLLCLVPSELASWLILTVAAVSSSIFLLRNLAPIFLAHARHQAQLFLAATGFVQVIFMLSLKLCFYNA